MTAYATDTFNGDGSTVEFTIDFDYIQRDHVQVYRVETANNAETELTVIASGDPGADEYVWETDKRIRVGTAPTDEQQLKVQRDTPEDQQLVQWRDGSYIIAKDLNDSDLQWLYGLQELEDKVGQLQSTAIKYLGAIDLTVDPAPAQPASGDFYINTGTGVVVDSWAGIAGDDVIGSEQVVYNGEEEIWQIFVVPASQIGVVSVTGTDPIEVDNTDPQRPVVSFEGQLDVIVQDDAPDNPEEGWLWFSTTDNRLYVYTGNEWVDASPMGTAACSIGDNFPLAANSTPGDLFWHTEYSTLFVFYTDQDSSQWVTASPTGAGNEGGASVEVGETPPDPATSAAGDLFWSEETGRLYVFAQGAWIDASPDGAAPEFWTRSNGALSPANSGDDLDDIGAITASGKLGIYGAIPDNESIKLNLDANSTNGITVKSTIAGTDTGAGIRFIKSTGNTADDVSLSLGMGGSITTTGEITVNKTESNSGRALTVTNTDGRAGRPTIRARNTGGNELFSGMSADGTTATSLISSDGSASFAGDVDMATTSGVVKVGSTDGLRISLSGNTGKVYIGLDENVSSDSAIRLEPSGNAWFKGTVRENQTRSNSIEILLDPDNSANYVSTQNADGEIESVYSGPVLDVKESIRTMQAALYRLKAAVLIPDTTVDQLRLRILEALETITEEVDS